MESLVRVPLWGDPAIPLHYGPWGENILLMPKNLVLGVLRVQVSQAPQIDVTAE